MLYFGGILVSACLREVSTTTLCLREVSTATISPGCQHPCRRLLRLGTPGRVYTSYDDDGITTAEDILMARDRGVGESPPVTIREISYRRRFEWTALLIIRFPV